MHALVASGKFGKTDAEVVSTALELLQRRYDAKRAALHEALDEGERSGIAEDYSLEGLLIISARVIIPPRSRGGPIEASWRRLVFLRVTDIPPRSRGGPIEALL